MSVFKSKNEKWVLFGWVFVILFQPCSGLAYTRMVIYIYKGDGPVRTVLTHQNKDPTYPSDGDPHPTHPTVVIKHIKQKEKKKKKKKRETKNRTAQSLSASEASIPCSLLSSSSLGPPIRSSSSPPSLFFHISFSIAGIMMGNG